MSTTGTGTAGATAKPAKYPGWNLNLRWTNYREADRHYPMGIHHNYFGADSTMIAVREGAMMLVMDRLTDKPNWHIKVFDDEIATKWKAEALAWPQEDLWSRLHNCDEDDDVFMPTPILDKECVDYVSDALRCPSPSLPSFSVLTLCSCCAVVHLGTATQGRALQAHQDRAHSGCDFHHRQIG